MNLSSASISSALAIFAAFLVSQSAATAQDRIIKTDGSSQSVKILGVSGSSVQIQVGGGMIGVPLSTISRVEMPAPAEFAAATSAYAAKDYPKALAAMKTVTDKYKGLPVDWAREAMSLTGDIYVAMNDLPKAEGAYQDYLKAYPGKGSLHTDVGMARIAFSKKDYAAAKQKLEPIKEQALKLKNVPADVGAAYSKAFCLLGEVEEAQGNYSDALQDYLRTVTLFYHDGIAVASAQEKADTLRKERNIEVP